MGYLVFIGYSSLQMTFDFANLVNHFGDLKSPDVGHSCAVALVAPSPTTWFVCIDLVRRMVNELSRFDKYACQAFGTERKLSGGIEIYGCSKFFSPISLICYEYDI